MDGVVNGMFAEEGCCKGAKKEELLISELLTSETGICCSSFSFFSRWKPGGAELNSEEFKLPFMEAASSATREDRAVESMKAEDVEAASLAATAATVAFISSTVVCRGAGTLFG
jgi:hypothetical protein